MICLSGDLHHTTLQTGNQKCCDITELETAQLFLNMLEEAKVKVTFFISGKCFAEEWELTKSICESEFVEIGGHNYSCFTPEIVHRVWNKLVRSYNGPLWVQKRDAKRTIDIIKKKTGHTIKSWRNHMYMHGPFTEKALWQSGIKICSDGVKKDSTGPVLHPTGIYNFPLNVMPDHEHLFHAERTPEYVEWFKKRYNWSDDYGPDSYYIEEWTERVLDELKAHERDGIVSNMIIHPITMYLCDKFAGFRKILDFISGCETVFMSEILEKELQKNGRTTMTKPRVSIIMRCKNSDWVIAQALAGLFSQTFRDFELIVVDSGSTDRTLEIVKHYPCNLIEIEAKAYYPGKVLNMAIEHAQGEIIVFQNSDSVPLCDYSLERLVAAFDDPEIKGAFGRQIPRPEAVTWVRRDYDVSFPVSGDAPPWITLSLPLAAIRKDVWEQHKFYVDAWASEDTEWGNWARNNGHKIKYVADAIVMHSHNYNLKEIYGRRFVEGEADAFIYHNKDGVFTAMKRFVVSALRDTVYHIRQGAFIEMCKIPARRFVYQWAYYKGNKMGNKRKLSNNDDASVGQQIVLKHYGSERGSS